MPAFLFSLFLLIWAILEDNFSDKCVVTTYIGISKTTTSVNNLLERLIRRCYPHGHSLLQQKDTFKSSKGKR